MLAPKTHDNDTLALALATLGEVTEIEMILIDKVNKEADIIMRYHGCFQVQTWPM